MQEKVDPSEIEVERIPGATNRADALTKRSEWLNCRIGNDRHVEFCAMLYPACDFEALVRLGRYLKNNARFAPLSEGQENNAQRSISS